MIMNMTQKYRNVVYKFDNNKIKWDSICVSKLSVQQISWYLLPIHSLLTDKGTTFRHNGLFLHRSLWSSVTLIQTSLISVKILSSNLKPSTCDRIITHDAF